MSAIEQPQNSAPLLRVVHGDPKPTELAALVAVLAARAASPSGAGAEGNLSHNGWTDRSWNVRPTLQRSPGGWRASALPLAR